MDEGAFTPNNVPSVDHPVLVVPAGSIRNSGFVVVAVPPVKTVPVTDIAGVDAAPLTVKMFACPSRVAFTAVVSSVSVILLPLLPEAAEMSSTGNKSPLAMVECVKVVALEIGRSAIKIIQLK